MEILLDAVDFVFEEGVSVGEFRPAEIISDSEVAT